MKDDFFLDEPEDLPEMKLLIRFGLLWAKEIKKSAATALDFIQGLFIEYALQPEEQPAVWKAIEDWRMDAERSYGFLLDLLAWAGKTPVHLGKSAPPSPYVAAILPRLLRRIQRWAAGGQVADILKSYHKTLQALGSQVPIVTGGRVPAHLGVRFLHMSFGRVIHSRSAWFQDSYILRRAVRVLPF